MSLRFCYYFENLLKLLQFSCLIMFKILYFQLFDKLNADELRRFAFLVKAWHSSMPFKEFCDKVLDLYGPERKYLLEGEFITEYIM